MFVALFSSYSLEDISSVLMTLLILIGLISLLCISLAYQNKT